ncbi:type III pantothenate kinase [Helicobacter sp. 11S02629-2]|uniref:type III pantothenate kinase n=1 Tax=Helicobacter sp. 11S02629-2 TaxID=1476195 RepID=UPI000BA6EDB8|nr:type III pantothenate kinase [Helicobacter sp. 11S02629-2]PAF45567.1 pantothenate kinase [Helicobacter sp. 11S02629-2]
MSEVILCDIGNTFLHFYKKGSMWKEPLDKISKQDKDTSIVYISVNEEGEKNLLNSHKNCINLGPYIELDSEYKGLGVDRKAACKGVKNGVIVDAGSAITVDVMEDGIHLGGFILPGLESYRNFYADISKVLDLKYFNMGVDLESLPQSTKDALSFGALNSIFLTIKQSAEGKMIYFTGGDGKFFSRLFTNSIYDNTLVFKGMWLAVKQLHSRLANS